MHAKYRNGPVNGYRSNAMGMAGVAAASRISPEGSMRGQRMYNPEYRNYNRGGYGRSGYSKQFQPPLPPPRGTDIFVEAGRLAAEYLVSNGVLPANALSGKHQIDGLKNQLGNFQGFRSHEVENTQIYADGRVPDHSRSGSASLDLGPVRRRYSEEYNSIRSRNSMRGRTKIGSVKYNGSEVNKELGKGGSLVERNRASPGLEADSDASVGLHDEQPKNGNGEIQNSSRGEITQAVDGEAHVESGMEKSKLVEDADTKPTFSGDADAEPPKKSDDVNKLNDEAVVVKEGKNENDLEQKHCENKEVTASPREDTLGGEDHVDLMKHCKFVNVPTKARSSLTNKGSKGDQDPMNEDNNNSKRELFEGSGVQVIDAAIDNSAGNASPRQVHELKSLPSEALDAPAVEKELDVTNKARPGQCLRSRSFPERFGYKEQEHDEGLSGIGRSNSMFMERSGKRTLDHDIDGREDFKKLREWVPQSDGSPPLSSLIENPPMSQEPRTSQIAHENLSSDQRSLNISLFAKGNADSCGFMEEKQLFPGSFKSWDLNLVSENHDGDPMHIYPSVTQTGKVTTPIDVDLSISNNLPNKNGKDGVNNNNIEIIDLEDDAQEDKTFSNTERRGDNVFTDLDGFPNNVHNANEIPDVQDGYGLMISELLGNDSPNCSSVPTDLNSLHNHMGLPNEEAFWGPGSSHRRTMGNHFDQFLICAAVDVFIHFLVHDIAVRRFINVES
ncbi:hypothetical protein BUALT_Bualt03G0162200 [Buddleja alternifolia]|uniref:Uncharacterized protein n=1 Tax=Buddleja alternifolia TaxID=168488 RepID=A0AAV6XU69_9LAMI|nr:hypothetical protein BUALT_Bualt03G0162200 [Buddleja alternifolia]